MIAHLGDEYVLRMFATYAGRVPAEADLVCYWFERADPRDRIEPGGAGWSCRYQLHPGRCESSHGTGRDLGARRQHARGPRNSSSSRCATGPRGRSDRSGRVEPSWGKREPPPAGHAPAARIFRAWSDEPWVIERAASWGARHWRRARAGAAPRSVVSALCPPVRRRACISEGSPGRRPGSRAEERARLPTRGVRIRTSRGPVPHRGAHPRSGARGCRARRG